MKGVRRKGEERRRRKGEEEEKEEGEGIAEDEEEEEDKGKEGEREEKEKRKMKQKRKSKREGNEEEKERAGVVCRREVYGEWAAEEKGGGHRILEFSPDRGGMFISQSTSISGAPSLLGIWGCRIERDSRPSS